ncbi:MAG: heparinase II/III family protein, partial [candidate division Zixibacteria bacterium]|nr:heparinase II/III family protein [candidate division Zixibacteria bacterium]
MRADQIGKLVKKLASGQFSELADRWREEWRRREERRIYNTGQSAFDASGFDTIFTKDFLHRFASGDKRVDFVGALRGHADTEFMPGFALRNRFREYVEAVLPSERHRIIAAADHIVANRFPVFNLGFISYGDPPRWNYDPIHKVTAPECFYGDIDYLDPSVAGDSKIVWEISRFQFVYDLGQAYLLTVDEKYPRKFFELVHDWRRKNRDYHGVNFCSALESAFRIHALAWGIWFFKDSPSLTNEYAGDLYRLIYTCADFVRHHLSRYFSPNTHLLGEAYAIFIAGILFAEFQDAHLWQQLGHDTLLAELDRQFTMDGMHAELSTAYHGYAIEFLLSLVALCKQRNISLETRFHERLQQGVDVLTSLQRPDGAWPHIGDEDGGRLFFLSRVPASDFRPLLDACRALLSHGTTSTFVDSFWFCGETASNSPVRPAVKESSHLVGAGIIVSHSKAGMYSLLQCGSSGYGDSPHSHADMLHLDISVGADNFIIDPGTCVYTADLEKRNRYRSAAVHNGPTVTDLLLEDPHNPFGWLQQPNCSVGKYFKTASSEYYQAAYQVALLHGGKATISRSVLFL